jgi:suppressor of fused-like protein
VAISAYVEEADGPPQRVLFPQAPNRFRSGGPLRQVAAHWLGDHWHLITYGMSEMDEKESDDPEVSGWGFELTFRVAEDPDQVPYWAVDFLTNLAAYVWRTGHPFALGHHLDLRGPIRLDADTAITAAAIAADPVLGTLDGPFGSVEFLQVVGLSAAELELCRAWKTDGVLELLGRQDQLLVTRLDRPEVIEPPSVRAEIDQRLAADGSAMTELGVATLRWRRRGLRRDMVLTMGAGASAALGPALRRELIGPSASFRLAGDQGDLRVVVGPTPRWSENADGLEIMVALEGVEDLADLFDGKTGWGRLAFYPGLRFRVVA